MRPEKITDPPHPPRAYARVPSLSPRGDAGGEGLSLARRTVILGGAALTLTGCLGRSCYENNSEQRRFLGGLSALARPALASNNPLAVEEAARQSVALAEKVGAFTDWCGTLTIIEGSASKPTVAIEVGPQVSLYAFNDWTLAFAGSVADMFSTRNKEAPPSGLSDAAVAALKTFRLGDRVLLSGRLGEIAGSGLFDMSWMFGKSEADHRQFLQTPRFVARIEALAPAKK